jgi:hypothetical protein
MFAVPAIGIAKYNIISQVASSPHLRLPITGVGVSKRTGRRLELAGSLANSGTMLEVSRPMSSLSAFEPLVQSCLSNGGHHLSYVLFLHHTFIPHEFLHRSCSNRGHANEDFRRNQMLEGLQLVAASGQKRLLEGKCAGEPLTVIKISLLQRTMPILPPST